MVCFHAQQNEVNDSDSMISGSTKSLLEMRWIRNDSKKFTQQCWSSPKFSHATSSYPSSPTVQQLQLVTLRPPLWKTRSNPPLANLEKNSSSPINGG